MDTDSLIFVAPWPRRGNRNIRPGTRSLQANRARVSAAKGRINSAARRRRSRQGCEPPRGLAGRRFSEMTPNKSVAKWVDECAELCKPDRIHWCDGSEQERARLTREALSSGDLLALDP